MNTQLLTVAAAIVAFGAPALASAAPVQASADMRQAVVSYADLNLATSAGQAKLNARIRYAAKQVCGAQPDDRDLRAMRAFDACVHDSIGAATAAVPAPTLVAGSNGHKG